MQRFKKIIILACPILLYSLVYTHAIAQATSTVQVTLMPNQTTQMQIDKLFNGVDDEHLEEYLNDPAFQIGTNDDT